jgi:hypothetical protein
MKYLTKNTEALSLRGLIVLLKQRVSSFILSLVSTLSTPFAQPLFSFIFSFLFFFLFRCVAAGGGEY